VGGNFSLDEVEIAIQEVNPKKAKGPDLIMGQIIKNELAKNHIKNFITQALNSG
jgi:hypothetical protein